MAAISPPLPPAFAFLAAITGPLAIPLPRADNLDWDDVIALARRHRVTPALAEGMRRHGVAAAPRQAALIDVQANAAALEELAQAASVRAICQGFEAEGLPYAVLKGIPLSLQIHGRLGLRVSRDIDLLVAPPHMRRALELLAAHGFVPEHPEILAEPHRFEALLRNRKDIELHHHGKRQLLELHWRLFDNPRLLAGVQSSAAGHADLPMDFRCAVLPPSSNLRYLALHGCQHGWSRLKWLLDFAALVARIDAEAQLVLFRETAVMDGRRAMGQALVLSADLFGLPLEPGLRRAILADRRTAWLVGIARRCMIECGNSELEDVRFGSTAKNIGHYLLSGSPSYWLAEARFDLADMSGLPEDSPWRRFGGPGRLGAWLVGHLSRSRA